MTTSASSTAIQPTLEWAVEKYGADFFTVRWLWTRNEKVWRWETRSTLANPEKNIYGGLTGNGFITVMRNTAKIIRGDDTEEVKVYAYRLVARIRPTKPQMVLPVRLRAMTITERSVPVHAEHQEVDIPTYGIDVTNFDVAVCEQEMVRELHRLGLPMPISVEYASEYHFLPRSSGEDAFRRLSKAPTP